MMKIILNMIHKKSKKKSADTAAEQSADSTADQAASDTGADGQATDGQEGENTQDAAASADSAARAQ